MEALILLVLVAILFVLVRGQRVRTGGGSNQAALTNTRQPSRLERVSASEHELGIRPCSRRDCPECRLYVARTMAMRRRWAPHEGDPAVIDGTIGAVERVPRYGTRVDLYYLDPLIPNDPAWEVEAGHVVLANEMARFQVGDRVWIRFEGSRMSRATGNDYFMYEVRLLP